MHYLEPLVHGRHEGRIVKIKEGEHANKVGVVVYSDNLGKFHIVHAINSRNNISFGFHPTSNLLNGEKPLEEDNIPSIGDRASTIRGKGVKGRIQNIADNGKGVETAFIKTDSGEIVPTPLSNIRMESTLQKVRRILAESALLLEYNDEKNWAKFGPKISERLSAEGVPPEQHREAFNNAVEHGDPTKAKVYGRWIAERYANGGINRLEDIGVRVRPALEKFHDAKTKGKLGDYGVHPDIGRVKDIHGLRAVAAALPDKIETESGAAKAAKNAAKTGVLRHLVGENEHWQHFQLSSANNPTHEESRELAHHYGGGAGGANDDSDRCEWCTAQNGERSKEMMDHYMNQGDLHIFIPKNPKDRAERYQSHFESNQFMDKADRDTNPQKLFAERPYPSSYQKVIDKHLEDVFGS